MTQRADQSERITTADAMALLSLTRRAVLNLINLGPAGPLPSAQKVSGKQTATYTILKSEVLKEAKRRGLL